MARSKDETKIEEIMLAARKLVIRTGFYGLKMAEVAKTAGIATGTLYIYFEDKESLINRIYIETKKEIAAVLFNPGNQSDNFYESFRKMWFAYVRFCADSPEKMPFAEQFYNSGFLSDESIKAGESCFLPLNYILSEAGKNGILKNCDTELLKAQLMGPIHELVKLGQKFGQDWFENQLEAAFEMAWASIRR